MGNLENRKFIRVNTNLISKIREHSLTQSSIENIGNVTNLSVGGLFIQTSYPPPVGKVLEITFNLPKLSEPVTVKTIVRFSNDRFETGKPCGVGVEFLQLPDNLRDLLSNFVNTSAGQPQPQQNPYSDIVRNLTMTPLHRRIGEFYLQNLDNVVEAKALEEILKAPRNKIEEALKSFSQFDLVSLTDSWVMFKSPRDGALLDELRRGVK